MAKLPQYTAKLQGRVETSGGRRATGGDFGGDAAAAAGELATNVGRLGAKHIADMEAEDQREQLVGHSQLREQFGKELQDAETSGAPLDVIRERFDNAASELRGQARTKAGLYTADIHTANSGAVFDVRSTQISVERAASEAKTGATKVLASNAAILMLNPSYLPVAVDTVDTYLNNTFTGRMKNPGVLAEMKRQAAEHLTIAAVSGEIRLGDPKKIADRLTAGEWPVIGPGARDSLLGRAMTEQRANEEHDRQQRHEAVWIGEQKARGAKDEHLKMILDGKFDPKAVAADERFNQSPEAREHLFVFNKAWWDAKNGAEKHSNQRVVNALMLRVYARAGDPNKIYNDDAIYEALKAGSLNVTDFNRLRIGVAEQKDQNNSSIGRRISQSLGTMQKLYSGPVWTGREHIAANIINSWMYDVLDKVDAKRNTSEGPNQLFNPKSPDYVLAPEYMNQFVQSATKNPVAGNVVLQPGSQQDFPDGTRRELLSGGDPGDPDTGWKIVNVKGPTQMVLPTSGLTVKWNLKGDRNDLANWEPVESLKISGDDISPATARFQHWREEAAAERAEFSNSLIGR